MFSQADAASGDTVVVAVNRGAAPATARFAAPVEWGGRTVTDAWGNSAVTMAAGNVELTVAARAASVLVVGFTR